MKNFFKRILQYLNNLISFSNEIDYENASTSIRKNIAFRGTNVFILACAIVIASVGLNVNSIPVIIGAMLVSPVMGPILGFGLGLGTEDTDLVKYSLKNFSVMVGISILASALFFLLSPLSLANPSELLARTRPTIYDVLIALFGGLAGIIETSRKDKGSVITGVAIATALMPPLCTVGYGISIWKGSVIFGALYLFLINSVFIALATFAAVKYFNFPIVEATSETKKHLPKAAVYIILLIVIVPSVITAVSVIKENNFTIHAEKKKLYKNAEEYGITRSQIVFHEDATSMRQEISETEMMKGFLEHNDQQIKVLNDSIAKLTTTLSDYQSKEIPVDEIAKELFTQYPNILGVSLSKGSSIHVSDSVASEQIIAFITTEKPMPEENHDRIERWLKVRLKNENVLVVNQVEK